MKNNFQFIETNQDNHIFAIKMSKPPANAIDTVMSNELYEAFSQLNNDDNLRVGILHAEANDKRIFCGGWDLKAFAADEGKDEQGVLDLGKGGIGGLPEFWNLYKPVIVAVNGKAAGGGFEMLVGADIIVASEDSEFFLPEMHKGFLPDGGAIQQLHHLIPLNVLLDLILTGRKMSAEEAKHWGLVRDVVPVGEEYKKAREIAEIIASGAPLVAKALKEFLRETTKQPAQKAHQITNLAWCGKSHLKNYQAMLQSDDYNEGASAFAEKRPAKFTGK